MSKEIDLQEFALQVIGTVDYDIEKEARNVIEMEGDCMMVDEVVWKLEELIEKIVD